MISLPLIYFGVKMCVVRFLQMGFDGISLGMFDILTVLPVEWDVSKLLHWLWELAGNGYCDISSWLRPLCCVQGSRSASHVLSFNMYRFTDSVEVSDCRRTRVSRVWGHRVCTTPATRCSTRAWSSGPAAPSVRPTLTAFWNKSAALRTSTSGSRLRWTVCCSRLLILKLNA